MPVQKYPRVIGEFETIAKIAKGFSVARSGDGELKILDGKGYTREVANPALTAELRNVVTNPHKQCLAAIPTMDPRGPKYSSFIRHEARFCKFLSDSVRYYSALISRPDCGEWMETQYYADLLRSLWKGKRVAIVSEPDSKLLTEVRRTNEVVHHIPCPMYGAYAFISDFEAAAVKAKPEIVLLSVGPTATCLANRLSGHDLHALDLGSIGGLFQRW